MRDFHLPGRSAAHGTEAMVATSHPLASSAALRVLARGGNAVDAAIAAAAVLAVVEPQATGIGGDCFALYAPGGGSEVLAYNGSGRAPAAATIERMRALGLQEMPAYGPHSVTIPGAVDAWCRLLAEHGTMELAELLAPAIRLAEDGAPVHERVAFDWKVFAPALARHPDAARILLPGGVPPRAGQRHAQPALAGTLRRIAREGRAGFYTGPVAEDMVAALGMAGGLHTTEDFAGNRCDRVEPLTGEFRGRTIVQMPPNNQGLTALMMLNILSGYELEGMDPDGAERHHLQVEAQRLAYRDRDLYLADPEHHRVPVQELLSPERAALLRGLIDPAALNRSLPDAALRKSDTVCLTVVDRDRNAISFINSVYANFGSLVMAPDSGVLLQNRGHSFRLDPGHPNSLAPGKRPMHTIMPGLALRDGRVEMAFGVMGGDYQAIGQVQLLINTLAYGMNLQRAIDAPRLFHFKGYTEVERGIPPATVAALLARNHRIQVTNLPQGGAQAIRIDRKTGVLTGASDPRKDGCAIGF